MYRILRMFHWKCCYNIFRTRTMFTFFFTQTYELRQQTVLLMLISFKMKTRNTFLFVEKGNRLRYIKSLFNKINKNLVDLLFEEKCMKFQKKKIFFFVWLYIWWKNLQSFIDSTYTKSADSSSFILLSWNFLCNAILLSISMLTNNIDEKLKAIIEES